MELLILYLIFVHSYSLPIFKFQYGATNIIKDFFFLNENEINLNSNMELLI